MWMLQLDILPPKTSQEVLISRSIPRSNKFKLYHCLTSPAFPVAHPRVRRSCRRRMQSDTLRQLGWGLGSGVRHLRWAGNLRSPWGMGVLYSIDSSTQKPQSDILARLSKCRRVLLIEANDMRRWVGGLVTPEVH